MEGTLQRCSRKDYELMLYGFTEHRWIKLADSVTGDDISWTKDSRYIYVTSPQTDRPVVSKISVKDGTSHVVVNLDSFKKMSGDFGRWFGLAPDNSLIFFRRLDASEVYLLEVGLGVTQRCRTLESESWRLRRIAPTNPFKAISRALVFRPRHCRRFCRR